jgi:hypothetical protein
LKNPLQLEQHEREQQFLDGNDGRQMLHVTFGSVLTKGHTSRANHLRTRCCKHCTTTATYTINFWPNTWAATSNYFQPGK